MNDTGASESKAREHVRHLIDETWKKLNKIDVENSVFPPVFIKIAKNLARMAQCIYQHGDGHGLGHQETNEDIASLLIRPISIRSIVDNGLRSF